MRHAFPLTYPHHWWVRQMGYGYPECVWSLREHMDRAFFCDRGHHRCCSGRHSQWWNNCDWVVSKTMLCAEWVNQLDSECKFRGEGSWGVWKRVWGYRFHTPGKGGAELTSLLGCKSRNDQWSIASLHTFWDCGTKSIGPLCESEGWAMYNCCCGHGHSVVYVSMTNVDIIWYKREKKKKKKISN